MDSVPPNFAQPNGAPSTPGSSKDALRSCSEITSTRSGVGDAVGDVSAAAPVEVADGGATTLVGVIVTGGAPVKRTPSMYATSPGAPSPLIVITTSPAAWTFTDKAIGVQAPGPTQTVLDSSNPAPSTRTVALIAALCARR